MTDTAPSFPTLLQRFFVDHLRQRGLPEPAVSTQRGYCSQVGFLCGWSEQAGQDFVILLAAQNAAAIIDVGQLIRQADVQRMGAAAVGVEPKRRSDHARGGCDQAALVVVICFLVDRREGPLCIEDWKAAVAGLAVGVA